MEDESTAITEKKSIENLKDESGQTMDEFDRALDDAAKAPMPKPRAKTPEELLQRPSDLLDDTGPENDAPGAKPADQVAEGAGLRPWGIDDNGASKGRMAAERQYVVTAKLQFDDGINQGNLTVTASDEAHAREVATQRLMTTWRCSQTDITILAVRKR